MLGDWTDGSGLGPGARPHSAGCPVQADEAPSEGRPVSRGETFNLKIVRCPVVAIVWRLLWPGWAHSGGW